MRIRRPMRLLPAITGLTLLGLSLSPANAASANLSKSYHSTTSLPNGSIVVLDPHHADYIQPANVNNESRLLGVTLKSQDSLIALNPSDNSVQVAINGNVNTLVTTVNGDIKVGDQISASPFNGVGMEAQAGLHIVGVSQTAFTGKGSSVVTEHIKDKTGKDQTIKVGYIKLSLAIGTGKAASSGGSQPNFLQRLIKSLTGHTISTVRIILSIVVMFISLVSLVTLIYASIYGSIISIGRNPLAQHAVFRTLLSVMIMAVLTIAIACVAIYYLLR